MKKTNFILITSPRKKITPISILNLGRKDQYLNWKDQIIHVKDKVAKNIGILYKLRHSVGIHVLKQLYCTLVYPYLTYAVIAWGNTHQIKKSNMYPSK